MENKNLHIDDIEFKAVVDTIYADSSLIVDTIVEKNTDRVVSKSINLEDSFNTLMKKYYLEAEKI